LHLDIFARESTHLTKPIVLESRLIQMPVKSAVNDSNQPFSQETVVVKIGFSTDMGAYGFYDALEQVRFAEESGFASVSWPEAHGIAYNTRSPMLSLAAMASHTSRILLGTSVIIASQYNPVRVAEEAAMLDVISNGRFSLEWRSDIANMTSPC